MSYTRVMPRDLFNEANLLKCMGQLALLLHDKPLPGVALRDVLDGSGFKIEQNPADGSISVSSLRLYVANRGWVPLYRTLNSPRRDWPLYAEFDDNDAVEVFDNDGKFSKDFLAALTGEQTNG